MNIRLGPLIIWPTREILWKTTPECFREEFGCKVCVILKYLLKDHPTSLLVHVHGPHINTTIPSNFSLALLLKVLFLIFLLPGVEG